MHADPSNPAHLWYVCVPCLLARVQAEEQKRRAEADKLAALTALEKRSKEFLKEKEEKKALEMKIRAMQARRSSLRAWAAS